VAGFRLRVKLPPALKLRRTAGAFGEGGRRTAIALATAVSGPAAPPESGRYRWSRNATRGTDEL